jgi:hypothetical protein
MATPESDIEELMNGLIPFAQQMLEKNGEFFPYGGALTPSGELSFVADYDGKGCPSSQALIDLLKDGFKEAAKQGKYKATGIVFDAKVTPPGKTEKTDALVITLDHKDNYSIIAFIPYKLKRSLLKRVVDFGEHYFIDGAKDIFGLTR